MRFDPDRMVAAHALEVIQSPHASREDRERARAALAGQRLGKIDVSRLTVAEQEAMLTLYDRAMGIAPDGEALDESLTARRARALAAVADARELLRHEEARLKEVLAETG
jgi:hypothetical protein